jgi:glycosyltransferase involved in cell wall biosynthesis
MADARNINSASAAGSVGAGTRVALVIPALNEATTIRDVVSRALRRLERVIVVDDGSCDGTAAALDGLHAIVLRNSRPLGKAASLRRGMALALQEGATAVMTMDGDGQHAPEDIPRLLAACQHHPNAIIIGARLHERHNIPRSRYLANRFANFWIAWAAGCPLDDSQSGFRLYPSGVLRALNVERNRSSGFVFESEVLIDAARLGVKSIAVAVPAIYPSGARISHFRPVIDILLITRMVAWKLVSRGLYLGGLMRSLRRIAPTSQCAAHDYSSHEVEKSAERG